MDKLVVADDMFSGTDSLTNAALDQDTLAQFLAQVEIMRHNYVNEHGQLEIGINEDGTNRDYFNDFFDAI